MKHRAAMSLVEVVGSLAIIASILSTSAILINQSFSTHRNSLEHLRKMRSVEQFVDRWRKDVHECQALETGEQLLLSLSNSRQVRYAVSENTISRTLEIDSDVAGNETWTLPHKCSLAWNSDDSGRERLLIGVLTFSENLTSSNSIQMEPITLVSRIGVANVSELWGRELTNE